MAVSVYCAGSVDFNKEDYYAIVDGLITDDIPVTLFRPGLAFKAKGIVDPNYIVDINLKAMMGADIVLIYINGVFTVGTWFEAIWAQKESKRFVLYADPALKLSVYMRWFAEQVGCKWSRDYTDLAININHEIKLAYDNKCLIRPLYELGTLGG